MAYTKTKALEVAREADGRSNQKVEQIIQQSNAAARQGEVELNEILAQRKPYVLDIDLDYFHSERSIDPDDPATFYRLVRNAIAVTISTEPEYIEDCRDDGSDVTGESLLERMKQHIAGAMA